MPRPLPGEIDGAVVEALEREWRQLGEELHDHLCQSLAGSSMLLQTALRQAARGEAVSIEHLHAVSRAVDSALQEARFLSQKLNPTDLAGNGLMHALQDLAEQTSRKNIVCTFECDKPVVIPSPAKALAFYRVAQEAVRSPPQGANHEALRMALSVQKEWIRLRIRGPQSEGVRERLALMRQRAAAIGGELLVEDLGRGVMAIDLLAPEGVNGQATG